MRDETKEGSSGVDRKSREYIRGSEIAKAIKYSERGVQRKHSSAASCSRTIAMDVCNNFHLSLHLPTTTSTTPHQLPPLLTPNHHHCGINFWKLFNQIHP